MLAKHEISIFCQELVLEKIDVYTHIHTSHVHLIFGGLFLFVFTTGICKFEKEILSLQVTGDFSSNWYSETPVG